MTNVERGPLPSSLRDVLIKQSVENESDELSVTVAGRPLSFHRNFRLLLSSSVPLHIRGVCTGVLYSFSRWLINCKPVT